MDTSGTDPTGPAGQAARTTEASAGRYRDLDRWRSSEVLSALLEQQVGAVSAVAAASGRLEEAAVRAARRLEQAGRLVYVGAGSSGRLAALDALELAPTFGWPRERLAVLVAGEAFDLMADEGAEDDAQAGADAARNLRLGAQDVVVCVSASGSTPYTLAVLEVAAASGALSVALANNAASPLLARADVPVFLDSGPEVVAGSTRLGAGSAQKSALNLFSTLLMVRLGRVFHNEMVEVEPSNAKLRLRAEQIVARLAPCTPQQARAALHGAGNIKLALCLLRYGTLSEASERLQRARGDLRAALTPG